MRKLLCTSAALLVVAAGTASAQSATQDVGFEVQAINEISVSGTPSLTISGVQSAGDAPTSATASATYAITTNETNRKITVAIDSDMPSEVTLTAALTAPTGATSAGAVTLGTIAVDAVTGISTLNETGLGITYTLSATAKAGVVPAGTRTVTYTIVAGS